MLLVDKICREILGQRFVSVIEFLLKNADKRGFITLTQDEICKLASVSKPTLSKIFKTLETKKILKKIKNGVYKLSIPK